MPSLLSLHRLADWLPPRALLVSLALLLGLGGSCVTKHPGPAPLIVVAHFPTGARHDDDTPLRIQFDKPAVDEQLIGAPIADLPAELEPAGELSGTWLDAQTLVLRPQGLRPATRYRLRFTGQLAARTHGFAFTFLNRPLMVLGLSGVDPKRLPAQPPLGLAFNQPVFSADVSARCVLQGADGATIRLSPQSSELAATTVVSLTPETPLGRGRSYHLRCAGLGAVEGSEPEQSDFDTEVSTYPELTVIRTLPSSHDAPSDEVTLEIEFSNPMILGEVRRHVQLDPAPPALAGGSLDHGSLDSSGTVYRVVTDLTPQTDYVLRLSAGLVDVYGQRLAEPHEHRFSTGRAQPRMVLETGIFAVEPDSGGYSVWTRSLAKFAIRCAPVPRDRVVGLLTSSMDYDPWYASASHIEWEKHGLSPREDTVLIRSPKDNWHLENLALHERCGSPLGATTRVTGSRRGLFLAELTSGELLAERGQRSAQRVLANVTDLGVFMKAGTASGIVWVTRMSTGKPLRGADVELYSPRGNRVFAGETDASGLLRTPGSNELLQQPGAGDTDAGENWEIDSYRSQRMIAVVSKGDDLAVVDGNWQNGIQTWNFGVPEDRAAGSIAIRGFIQSDRGIYRPGETVHFKGIVRAVALGRTPALPGEQQAHVQVEDSRGATLFDGNPALSRFGGFHFDLKLPDEAKLGDYYVRATVGKQTFRERFFVEEFRPLNYEVSVEARSDTQRLGERISARVRADYLFGAPLAEAKTRWSVRRRDHRVSFEGYSKYTFADVAKNGFSFGWWDINDAPTHLADGEGVTNEDGTFELGFEDPRSEFTTSQDYLVSVSVTDATDQTVAKQKIITAHKTNFYLGLHTQEWLQAVDMPFSVNAVAVDVSGKRIATPATLRFVRMEYDCQTRRSYRSTQSCKERPVTVLTRDFQIPATGASTQRIVPKKPGDYVIRVEAKDARGRTVTASQFSFVIGKGEAFWSGDESARMTLVASKQKYEAGEIAKLLPRTNLKNAHALLTLERDGILFAKVEQLDSASDGLKVKLDATHGPNVWASVAIVSGRDGAGDAHRPRFKLGIVELRVATDSRRLKVVITPERQQVEPGQIVRGTVTVTSAGKPVAAELSLSAADEGVLQLIAYQTPDPMHSFYRRWGLGTDASTNWNRLARVNDPSALDPDEGGDTGNAQSGRVRSNFVSSAYWAPALVTDSNGIAAFAFTAPDNLTSFRLMVAAADDAARFGAAEQRVTVSKPLVLKSILPRYLTDGDRAQVGVLVHNLTGKRGKVTVRATAVGVNLEQAVRTFELDAGQVGRARFDAAALSVDRATFTFAATLGSHSDALERELPVQRALSYQARTVHSGRFDAAGGQREFALEWTPGALANESRVELSVDRSGLADLVPGLRSLVEYPYGCLEQTLSRFIPLAKLRALARALGDAELEGSKAEAFIAAGAAKVVRHQHADGHYSLWPSGETQPHLTAYATFGLLEAKRAGTSVDDSAIQRGVDALRLWANQRVGQGAAPGELGAIAMAAYVLAESGQPDVGLNAKLFELRRGLPRFGSAFLLRALQRGTSTAFERTLRTELLAVIVEEKGGAHVIESGDLSRTMSSDVRSTALTLTALLESAPDHPLGDKLAAGLRAQRLSSGTWRSTQDNVYALMALAAAAERMRAGQVTATWRLGEAPAAQRVVSGLDVHSVTQSRSLLAGAPLYLASSGALRYAVTVTEALPLDVATSTDNGFSVTRSYLDPKTNTELSRVKAGELVKIRLSFSTPADRRYVALVDRMPAGFEAVNAKLATSKTELQPNSDSWSWTHVELHDDRALAFADWLPRGAGQFEYLVRATIPGTFRALPSHLEAMYEPEISGRTSTATVEVIQ
jgi:hypothetical protein